MKTNFILLSLMSFISIGNAATTKLTWHGHAAFEITTPEGNVLMIDPWLNNPANPAAKDKKDPVKAVKKLDYILITHGHFDHVGDAVKLAKNTKAKLVTGVELGANIGAMLGYPKNLIELGNAVNAGGEIKIAHDEVMVAGVNAVHSSGINHGRGSEYAYGGAPMGFVIKIKNGPTFYHTGDTAYFGDMKVIGEHYSPDVSLINIGGKFGMEPDMAAEAAIAVKAKLTIPQHYKTFPGGLNQDETSFVKAVKEKGITALVMRAGQTIEFDGKNLVK